MYCSTCHHQSRKVANSASRSFGSKQLGFGKTLYHSAFVVPVAPPVPVELEVNELIAVDAAFAAATAASAACTIRIAICDPESSPPSTAEVGLPWALIFPQIPELKP